MQALEGAAGAAAGGAGPRGAGEAGGAGEERGPCLHGDRVQQMENTDMGKNSNRGVKNSIW